MASYKQLVLAIVVHLALASVTSGQMLHNKPIHSISVNGKYYDVVVETGTEITFNAVVTDAGADLTTHVIEVAHPNGTLSSDGWLTDGDWSSNKPDSGAMSSKTAKVTVVDAGAYTFKARATHEADGLQYSSNFLRVIVRGLETFPQDYVPDTILYPDGTVNRTAYELYWLSWSPIAQSKRFGPSFNELHPRAQEDRPTNAQPGTFTCPTSYKNKYSPYELGRVGCGTDDASTWSSVGQVGYIPTLPGDPGIDRIQTVAYYANVFALSPRLDQTSGTPHPDPTVKVSEYQGQAQFPIASTRNYGQVQNEALTIYRSGLLAVNGLQSSRANGDRPFPGFVFPSNLVPTDIAVTTGNELALVTLWDTQTLKGKLAVVAIEAKFLPLFTTPYLGMPNQGSFSDLVLLGYVDLPIAAPTSVSATSNHRWSGPSDTNGLTLGQLDFTSANVRQSLYNGAWSSVVATKGYAIVASKFEDKVCIVDLSPVLQSFREAWLNNYNATLEARASGIWPASFAVSSPDANAGHTPTDSMVSDASRLGWSDLIDTIRALWSVPAKQERHVEDEYVAFRQKRGAVISINSPRIVTTLDLDGPTAVFAGNALSTSSDRFKAHVALGNGKVAIIDASSLMSHSADDTNDEVKVMGSFDVCEGPTAIVPARFAQQLPQSLSRGNSSAMSDPLNNHFYVVCRGSREIAAVMTSNNQGTVYQRLKDIRLEDPVNAVVSDRANVLTVTDYNGRKVVSFLIGNISDPHGRQYATPASGFQYVGEMPLDGFPFAISVAPVN